jgi:hypothetical protein
VADDFPEDDSPSFYCGDTFDRGLVGAESENELWSVRPDRVELQGGGLPVEREVVVSELVKSIAHRDGDVRDVVLADL